MDQLPPPVIPRNFYAAGLNYRAHIEWANSRGASHKVPTQPDIGYRAASALIGSGHGIVIPADSPGPVEYEGGRTVSSYNTRGMIFSVARYISRMSRYVTLHPDDVIWFGCDGPTEPALKDGDLVEVVNDAIGVLANRVRKGA